jgi:tRNA (guanine26-N2/guanine27-N2)-dimethyltransferase
MGGPFWAEPLHDPAFVRGVLAELRARRPAYAAFDRVQGLLASVLDELPDAPLYFDLHAVAKTLRCSAPRAETIRSALVNAGFRASGTHCSPLGVKTDAPWSAIWDIMRCWVAEHPAKPPPGSSGALILAKAPELKADFARAAGAVQHRGKGRGKVARFLPNPEANWGPKPKHGRGVAPSGRHAAAAAAAVGAGAAAAAEPMEAEAAGEATEEEPAAAEDGANGANGAAAEAPAAAVPPQADG